LWLRQSGTDAVVWLCLPGIDALAVFWLSSSLA
jgi:hypothetical protein